MVAGLLMELQLPPLELLLVISQLSSALAHISQALRFWLMWQEDYE